MPAVHVWRIGMRKTVTSCRGPLSPVAATRPLRSLQTCPSQRNDVLGLSTYAAAAETLHQIRGFPTGTAHGQPRGTATFHAVASQFDNLDGFRHAHFGNLLGAELRDQPPRVGGRSSTTRRASPPHATPARRSRCSTSRRTTRPTRPRRCRCRAQRAVGQPAEQPHRVHGQRQRRRRTCSTTPGRQPGSGTGGRARQRPRASPPPPAAQRPPPRWLDNDNVLALDPNGALQRVTVDAAARSASAPSPDPDDRRGTGNPFARSSTSRRSRRSSTPRPGTSTAGPRPRPTRCWSWTRTTIRHRRRRWTYSTSINTFREAAFDSREPVLRAA